MKLIITVDTEADNQWKKKGEKITLENINYLPRFQKFCESYNFFPTYLLAYEVASDENAAKLLSGWQKSGKAEIGAHLHPWTNPPINVDDDLRGQPFPSELADQDLWLKLKILTETITSNFGKPPTSYRAGRFGFDARTADYLLKLGYKVDASVTPKVSWKKTVGLPGGPGGPDFRRAGLKPYYLSEADIAISGNTGLLELPLTIIYAGLFKDDSSICRWFTNLRENHIKQALNGIIFKKKWLRIFQSSKVSDWQAIYKAAVKNKLEVLEFMIHSSELMPGGSPYAKDEKEVENIYLQLEEMFKIFKDNKMAGMTLSAFAEYFKNK